jgi:hypothetical protein
MKAFFNVTAVVTKLYGAYAGSQLSLHHCACAYRRVHFKLRRCVSAQQLKFLVSLYILVQPPS